MKVILDLKGTIIHSLNAGEDLDGTKTSKGAKLNSVGHCIENFLNIYILPSLEFVRLADIIAVRDSDGTTKGNIYRTELYPAYKANRDKDPEKVDQQMVDRVRECEDTIFSLLKGLGIPVVDADGIEGDDIIAYLIKNLPEETFVVHTVDHDLLQLSSERVGIFLKGIANTEGLEVWAPKKAATKTRPEVPKTLLFTVLPRHIALYKSLVGDASDNYGGIKGFGAMSFKRLLDGYELDGLDELVAIVRDNDFNGALRKAIDETNDKDLQMLYDNRDTWALGWKLANLNPDLVEARKGRKFNRLRHTKRVPNPDSVKHILKVNGCRHLEHKLKEFLPVQTLVTKDNIDLFPVRWFAEEFKKSPMVSIDWETTDELKNPAFKEAVNGREFVDMLSSSITGSGFTFGRNLEHTVYISYGHARTNNLDREFLLDVLTVIPDDVPVVIQNVYFEINVLKNTFGVSVANCHDTKVMSSYVNENTSNGLKESSKEHLNYDQIKYKDVIEDGKTMADYSAAHVFQYGADDPLVTAHLYDHYKLIMQLEGTFDFCIANEFKPIEMLSDGFLAGVEVDWVELNRQAEEDRETFRVSMEKLRELIQSNQTAASYASGCERLIDEGAEEVRAKASDRFLKSVEGQDLDDVAFTNGQDQATDEAYSRFVAKVEELVKYEPLTTETEYPVTELTVTGLKPILVKLGLPPLTDIGSQAKVIAYTSANKGVSIEADDFLEVLAEASGYNKTSAAILAKGEGRAHPIYKRFQEHAKRYTEPVTKSKGSELNLNSPTQMNVLLYGMLDLPIRLRGFEVSESRQALGLTKPTPQANEDAIVTALAEDCKEHPWKKEALEALRDAKKCQTRLNLFYDVYPLWKHPIDGLIHPQINSCGTETRRPTGSSPNPLQWPKRGDGVKFRRCILPNKKLGHDLIVSIDWSQQELRIAGALSGDEVLLDCYIGKDVEHVLSDDLKELMGERLLAKFLETNTKDVHTQTATGLLKWAYEDVVDALEGTDKELAKQAKKARTDSKPINFGSTYGIGASKLARQLICPIEEAKQFLRDKKELYWGFEEWRDAVIALVDKQGYVTTAFGNRRHAHSEVVSVDKSALGAIHRQIVNYLIQGVAADNLKRTLTEIYDQGILERTGSVIIAPIYDEIVFSAHHESVVDLILSVHKVMTRDIPGMAVPMLAEPSLGVNFGDQIEIGRFPTKDSIEEAVWKAFASPLDKAA